MFRRFLTPLLLAACMAASLTLPGALGTLEPARADSAWPWMNTSKTPDQRAKALVAAMTLDQKISIVHQHSWMAPYGTAGYIPGDPSLCIPDLVFSDSGQGVGGEQQFTAAFPRRSRRRRRGTRRCSTAGAATRLGGLAQGHQHPARAGVRHRPRPDERPQLRVHGRGPVPRRPAARSRVRASSRSP